MYFGSRGSLFCAQNRTNLYRLFSSSALSKAEIVKRSLDFLHVPLVFYVTERLKALYSEAEVNTMLLNRHGRVRQQKQLILLFLRLK